VLGRPARQFEITTVITKLTKRMKRTLPNLASLSLHCPPCGVAPTGVTRDRFTVFLPGVNLKDGQPEPEVDDNDKECKICNGPFAHPARGFVQTDGPPARLQNELDDLWMANPRDPEAIAAKQQELDGAIDFALPILRTADPERFQVELLIPGCGHQFHLKCLKGWINAPDPRGGAAVEDRRLQCPICSLPVDSQIVGKLSTNPNLRRNVRAREDDDAVRFLVSPPRSPDNDAESNWQAPVTDEDGSRTEQRVQIIQWANRVKSLGTEVSDWVSLATSQDGAWDGQVLISHRETHMPFSVAWEILLGRIELLCADAFLPNLSTIVQGGNPFGFSELGGMAYWPYEIFENLPIVEHRVKVILESWRSALDDSIIDVSRLMESFYTGTTRWLPRSEQQQEVLMKLSDFLWHFTGESEVRDRLMLNTDWRPVSRRTPGVAPQLQYPQVANHLLNEGQYAIMMDDNRQDPLRNSRWYKYEPAYIDLIVGVRLSLSRVRDELAMYRDTLSEHFHIIPYGNSVMASNLWTKLNQLSFFVESRVASYRNKREFMGIFPAVPTAPHLFHFYFRSFFGFHRAYTQTANQPQNPMTSLIMNLLKAMATPFEPRDLLSEYWPPFDEPLQNYRYDANWNIVEMPVYSPQSPSYSPTSPQYSPTSPQYELVSRAVGT